MSYTSPNFLLFVALTLGIYFLFPWKKHSWVVLLAASYYFYLCVGYRYAVYLLFTTVSAYLAGILLEKISLQAKDTLAANKKAWDKDQKKAFKSETKRRKQGILTLVLVLNFGILIFLKYYNMFAGSLNGLFGASFLPQLRLILPLGISFYTFQAMGYLVDVYREKVSAQRSLPKFALFLSFFPQIVQGPIGIYDNLAQQLYTHHGFDFTRFKHGCMLMLWGFLQKLVIADRAVMAISTVTGDYGSYNGTTLTFTVLLYALQLYADFAGGVDISRGVGELFGITLGRNFRQPYFAVSINDYWRRWHMSLGEWFKNYLFYPLAMSKTFLKAGKKIKASAFGATPTGEHWAKVLPTSFASFIVFFLVGVWHGPNWKYVAFGIWNGGIIMLSVLLKPQYTLLTQKLKINTGSFPFRLFQMARTFLIVLVGYVFDVAPDLGASLDTFRLALTDQNLGEGIRQIGTLGINGNGYAILLLGVAVLLAVGIFHEKTGKEIRYWLDEKPFICRYIAITGGLLILLSLGIYGPGYDPAAFVYMQF